MPAHCMYHPALGQFLPLVSEARRPLAILSNHIPATVAPSSPSGRETGGEVTQPMEAPSVCLLRGLAARSSDSAGER
jgi:hypothetical protein